MRVRILGCGTSSGVPRIGNDWGDCDPQEPRNRRSRASVLVEHDGTTILVDTGPDMREQLLAAHVSHIDAVIWTHDHADHCHGIDDLRQVYHAMGRPVLGYARPEVLEAITTRFGYAFAGRTGYPPTVRSAPLPDRLTIGAIAVTVVDQPHGNVTSAGLRFNAPDASVGYATDFAEVTDAMADLYRGVDLWIADALRQRPHPTHANLATVLDWHARLRPGLTVLTHMDQTMDYASLQRTLPPGVMPGHDGMTISCSGTDIELT